MKNKARGASWNRPKTNREEDRMADLIDNLTDYEDFVHNVLPALRRDVETGMSTGDLRKKYASLIQARVITEALTNPDAGKALTAAADLLNRVEGKATERKEIKHSLADLPDKELDAILESELKELEEMEERFEQ